MKDNKRREKERLTDYYYYYESERDKNIRLSSMPCPVRLIVFSDDLQSIYHQNFWYFQIVGASLFGYRARGGRIL